MKLIMAALLIGLSSQATATDEEFLYSLGGALPLSRGATNRVDTHTIGLGLGWDLDLACDNFSMKASVENQIKNAQGMVNQLMNDVVGVVQGSVAGMIALGIQRLNPALYDLLQNGVLSAKTEFDLSRASCRQMTKNMEKTIDQEGWRGLAKGGWWSTESNTAGSDVVESERRVETQGPDHGVTWVGGVQAAGAGQDPILINRDTVKAGYNLLLKRPADDNTAVSVAVCDTASICQTWDTPDKAAKWLTDVIGDKEIQTCIGCDKLSSNAGMGLNAKYEQEQELIADTLRNILTGTTPINATNLEAISGATGLRVTRPLIEAVLEENEPDLIIGRLSGELAMTKTMDRALLARRSLLAGIKEPNISNNKLAKEDLKESVAELTAEIEGMMFEIGVREKMGSSTAVLLLQRARLRGQAPIIETPATHDFSAGAVQ